MKPEAISCKAVYSDGGTYVFHIDADFSDPNDKVKIRFTESENAWRETGCKVGATKSKSDLAREAWEDQIGDFISEGEILGGELNLPILFVAPLFAS